jgi:hypothetical protein
MKEILAFSLLHQSVTQVIVVVSNPCIKKEKGRVEGKNM